MTSDSPVSFTEPRKGKAGAPEAKGAYLAAVGQFEPVFLDKEANLAKMFEMAEQAAARGARLMVFPECCLTGYAVGPAAHEMAAQAEPARGPEPGPSVRRVAALANELDLHIIFGLPESFEGRVYNTVVLLTPKKGLIGATRKVHMWEEEGRIFALGSGFQTRPGPLGLLGSLICYDLEFPESTRLLALAGTHLAAVSTANMFPWDNAQRVFAQARALENCIFVAVANCIGRSGDTVFCGGSIITDPYGNVLAEAGPDEETILVGEINLELNKRAREETSYFKKRRPEIYGPLAKAEPVPKD